MNKINRKLKKDLDFEEYLAEQLKNPEIKKYYDEYEKQLEIAYKILQLRKHTGISQSEFAKKIGAKQSNIARMEAGDKKMSMAGKL